MIEYNRTSRRSFAAGSGLAMAALVAGTTSLRHAAAKDDAVIHATITTGMIADTVRNVGGDLMDATALMGPGIDPHLYKPTAGDINRLGDADIILYNGLHLEGRMGDTLAGIARSGKPVVAVAEAVPEENRLAFQDYEDQYDPHVWFDVSLWTHVVESIAAALSDYSPDNADTFRTNADDYLAQLDELDAYVMEQAERVPEEQRVLVTAHDAFGYFGAATASRSAASRG